MSAERQLEAIRDISAALSSAPVGHWLTGGWAVDFAVGSVTRPHKDVDLVIERRDEAAAADALHAAGFQPKQTQFPEERLELERDGVDVEVLFVERTTDGALVTPGRWASWPPDTLDGPGGRIGEVACPVVSLAAQLESKRGYEQHVGQPPRPQDIHDLRLLDALSGAG